jgi:hypothetical protein
MLLPRWEARTSAESTAGGPRPAVEQLCDILVPDALWYQILSAGHLEPLGGPPPGSVDLPDGRVELAIGEPEQWLPGHPDLPAVQAQARELLAACLVTADEAFAMSSRRMREARGQG